jgi:hypothetical protein
MKNSVLFIVLFAATILGSLILPWWIIAPLAIVLTYISKPSPFIGFILSFLAVFLAWIISIYLIDNGTVSELMGKLFEVPAFLTPIIAALIGGITSGIFGLGGALLAPKKKNWVNA